MANCRLCGKPAGWGVKVHEWCDRADRLGIRVDQLPPRVVVPKGPLTATGVFWAVFGALWAFGVTAAILAAILKALAS